MKRLFSILLLFGSFVTGIVHATECTTIKDGTLYTSVGDLITHGYDQWGYNYEAHMFNGGYCDAYRDAVWCQDYKDVDLIIKWNDAWLSNKDCDSDNMLDRHFGDDSYIGSGAWTTNHMSGKVEVNGRMRKWTYFVKIIAVPSDAVPCGDEVTPLWCAADGIEIGKAIWGPFAIVQEVYNDPSEGKHGVQYKSPVDPGLGNL